MLTSGDEIGKTQRGNNNPYCQDNALSWIDWAARRGAARALRVRARARRAAEAAPGLSPAHVLPGRARAGRGDEGHLLGPRGRQGDDGGELGRAGAADARAPALGRGHARIAARAGRGRSTTPSSSCCTRRASPSRSPYRRARRSGRGRCWSTPARQDPGGRAACAGHEGHGDGPDDAGPAATEALKIFLAGQPQAPRVWSNPDRMDPLSKAAAGIGMAERQLDGAAGKLSRLGTGGADVDEAARSRISRSPRSRWRPRPPSRAPSRRPSARWSTPTPEPPRSPEPEEEEEIKRSGSGQGYGHRFCICNGLCNARGAGSFHFTHGRRVRAVPGGRAMRRGGGSRAAPPVRDGAGSEAAASIAALRYAGRGADTRRGLGDRRRRLSAGRRGRRHRPEAGFRAANELEGYLWSLESGDRRAPRGHPRRPRQIRGRAIAGSRRPAGSGVVTPEIGPSAGRRAPPACPRGHGPGAIPGPAGLEGSPVAPATPAQRPAPARRGWTERRRGRAAEALSVQSTGEIEPLRFGAHRAAATDSPAELPVGGHLWPWRRASSLSAWHPALQPSSPRNATGSVAGEIPFDAARAQGVHQGRERRRREGGGAGDVEGEGAERREVAHLREEAAHVALRR